MTTTKLQVHEGGRHLIEREALYAIFTQPDDFPVLLDRLKPTANTRLALVKPHVVVDRVQDKGCAPAP
jgi:hypothetical protein